MAPKHDHEVRFRKRFINLAPPPLARWDSIGILKDEGSVYAEQPDHWGDERSINMAIGNKDVDGLATHHDSWGCFGRTMTTSRLSIVRLPEIPEVAPAAEDSRRDCAAESW